MNDAREPGLVKDEMVLPDGRYLIFYSFTDGPDEQRERMTDGAR